MKRRIFYWGTLFVLILGCYLIPSISERHLRGLMLGIMLVIAIELGAWRGRREDHDDNDDEGGHCEDEYLKTSLTE